MKPQDRFVRYESGSERLSLEAARALPRSPVTAILDNIRSAHNVGSMFRTADGAGAGPLRLCGYTPTPPHRHLAKTALRAVEVVPWEHYATTREAILAARKRGEQLLAMEFTQSSQPLYEVELRFPVCLVMGNEVEGLSPELQALCNHCVHLPMIGLKSSLNVSVAFGVGLYEVLRRYSGESEAQRNRGEALK